MRDLTKSQALFESASQLLPLGTTSNFRYWGPEGTLYVRRGKGAHLWDVDGNRYIDYRLAYGPAILGHSNDRVDEAAITARNRVGMAAANATLDILANTHALERVAERGREVQAAITEVLGRTGRPFIFSGHPSLSSFWFADRPPRDYQDWLSSDHSLYGRVAAGLIERGVMPEPDSREPWFMCAAHSSQDVAETATALEETLRDVLSRR